MKVYPHWTRNCSRVNNGRRGVIGSHVFYESCKGYPRAYPNLEIDGEEEEAATAMYKNDQLNDELLAIVDKINGKAEKEPKGLLEKMNQSLKEIYQYVFS